MEFITTTEKTDKNGHKYYVQEFKKMDMDDSGKFTEKIIWSGRATKEDYEWCKMIAETQPERKIAEIGNMLTIIN
jgi:hypothetical protein